MSLAFLVFKLHYRSKFDRLDGCIYIGGKLTVHNDPYNPDCLFFIEVEGVVKEYGYWSGDLLFYLDGGCT